jgi:hypothetical protein
MDIEIRLEGSQPPRGTIRSDRTLARVFDGWLGMLRELSALVDDDPAADEEILLLTEPDTTPRR